MFDELSTYKWLDSQEVKPVDKAQNREVEAVQKALMQKVLDNILG